MDKNIGILREDTSTVYCCRRSNIAVTSTEKVSGCSTAEEVKADLLQLHPITLSFGAMQPELLRVPVNKP